MGEIFEFDKEELLNNRYKVIRKIGHGGQGEVYMAEDSVLGKVWAVKRITHNAKRGKMFAANELKMMKELDYPLFPRIVDAFCTNNAFFIVSDYIEGRQLDEVLNDSIIGKYKAIDFMIEIVKGLSYLNGRDPAILYLDLKPENIIMKENGELCLIDFGIARNMYMNDDIFGTPGYASPEQYEGDGSVLDCRADIFAAGMLLYTLLSGIPPNPNYRFQVNTIICDRHISQDIKTVILKCIQYKKEDRYATCDYLLNDLIHIKNKSERNYVSVKIFLVIALFFSMIYIGANSAKMRREYVVEKMLNEAGMHINNGEYDIEGVKIIGSYIDGELLDGDVSDKYAYEIAMNYFTIQKDYIRAKSYFEILSKEKYPEAKYYIDMCNCLSTFENDNDFINHIEQFEKYNLKLPISYRRCKNTLVIASCYEGVEESLGRTYGKSYDCLKREYDCLRRSMPVKDKNNINEQMRDIYGEYARRLFLLLYREGDYQPAIEYAAEALEFIDGSRKEVIEDLNEKITEMKKEDIYYED